MIPEFAQAIAASKRAKKLTAEADRLIIEAESCSKSRGNDSNDMRRRIETVGDALAAAKAAQSAAAISAESMQTAFAEWKIIR